MLLAFYCVPTVLALLVVIQHLYFAFNYKLTKTNISKLIGAVLILMCGIISVISQAINPQGLVFGYPTEYDAQSYILLVNALLAFLTIGVAINTANWVRVGLSAISPKYRNVEGWSWPSKLLVWFIAIYETVLGIYFAVSVVRQKPTEFPLSKTQKSSSAD